MQPLQKMFSPAEDKYLLSLWMNTPFQVYKEKVPGLFEKSEVNKSDNLQVKLKYVLLQGEKPKFGQQIFCLKKL